MHVISFSPHVRECKTQDSTYWIPDANRQWNSGFLRAQDSGSHSKNLLDSRFTVRFHKQKFPAFQNLDSLTSGQVLLNDDNYFLFICVFFCFFALSARETFNSFSEEKFCEYMKRATLRGEEFAKHREAIRELLRS